MNNANIEYEKFAQEVYQELVNADVVKSTEVRHDIKILGKSGQKHQIDVYWEYEIAGVLHKVAIECKNYNKPVPVSKVRDFYGVLSDLNNVSNKLMLDGMQTLSVKWANSDTLEFYVDNTRVFGILAKWVEITHKS